MRGMDLVTSSPKHCSDDNLENLLLVHLASGEAQNEIEAGLELRAITEVVASIFGPSGLINATLNAICGVAAHKSH